MEDTDSLCFPCNVETRNEQLDIVSSVTYEVAIKVGTVLITRVLAVLLHVVGNSTRLPRMLTGLESVQGR